MNWKTKAAIYRLLSATPYGERVAFALQRYVTRSLPRKESRKYMEWLRFHVDNLEQEFGKGLGAICVFEFGAGWDLFHNIGLWCAGVDRQLVVDIRSNANLELINLEIQRFMAMEKWPRSRKPERAVDSFQDLHRQFGIDYSAPCDARSTGIESKSVDAVCSTNTLEHIPRKELARILVEMHRILKENGVCSAIVDYSDHYSHADTEIGPYNYMYFSEADWEKYNPSMHFQNRLQHSDYIDLFESAGFELVSHSLSQDPETRKLDLDRLHPNFRNYSSEDLQGTTGFFLLRKAPRVVAS